LVAYPVISYDGFVTTQEMLHSVIPAEAGIQFFRAVAARLDPGRRRGDEWLRCHQFMVNQKTIGVAAQI
jgi:hypothetical protein